MKKISDMTDEELVRRDLESRERRRRNNKIIKIIQLIAFLVIMAMILWVMFNPAFDMSTHI